MEILIPSNDKADYCVWWIDKSLEKSGHEAVADWTGLRLNANTEPCRYENTFGGILVTLGSKPCLEIVVFILLVFPFPHPCCRLKKISPASFRETCQWLKFPLNSLRAQSRVMKHYSPTGRRNHGRHLKRLLDTWDRKGSTSGRTQWKICDDDDDDDDDDRFTHSLQVVSLLGVFLKSTRNNDLHLYLTKYQWPNTS